MIEEAYNTSAIEDSETVQKFLDELMAKYYSEIKLNKDLTKAKDERFFMFMRVVKNAPNKR
jgi:hypothetical protein